MYPKLCDGCPARDVSLGYCPPDLEGKLIVYGETPGEEEVGVGGFVGRSGRLLRACEQRAGLNVPMPELKDWKAVRVAPGEVAHRNVICCRPKGNKWPGDKLAEECMRRHAALFPSTSSLRVLACGANATRVLTGWVEEITETRGTCLPVGQGGFLVSTLHPAFLLRADEEGKSQDHLRPVLIMDIMKAMNGAEPRYPQWVEVTTGEKVLQHLMAERPETVAIDMEGTGYVGVGWEDTVYGMWWDEQAAEAIRWIFQYSLPIFHNATYDLDQLLANGVEPPEVWVDTIVMAHVLDPCVPLNLQAQVLSHVPGSVAWKGLIANFKAPETETREVRQYVDLWKKILGEYVYVFPNIETPKGRLAVYNALDVWGTWHLARRLRERLGAQMGYYRSIQQPLQKLLYDLGNRGLPVDTKRMAEHRSEIRKKEDEAKAVLARAAQQMLLNAAGEVEAKVEELIRERDEEMVRAGKKVKFSKSEELTKLRTKLKTRQKAVDSGFNVDSFVQRKGLLKTWFGLKLPKHRKTRKETTNDKTLERMLGQLRAGTLKHRRGTREEVEAILSALVEGKKWATWRRNYLTLRGEME